MPAVVQALRPVIAQSAVLGSPNQARFPPMISLRRPFALRMKIAMAAIAADDAIDGKVERGTEERPAADLLVDDQSHQQAESHLERDDDDRVLDRVLDRSVEGRVVEEVAVVLRPDALDLPEDPPFEEADVDRVPERIDEEDSEYRQRKQNEGVAPTGLTKARPEKRAASRGRESSRLRLSSQESSPSVRTRPHGRGQDALPTSSATLPRSPASRRPSCFRRSPTAGRCS